MSEKNETPIIDRAVNAGGNQLLNVVTAGRSLELAANALRDGIFSQMVDRDGKPSTKGFLPLYEILADIPDDWAQAHAINLRSALAQFDALRKGIQ